MTEHVINFQEWLNSKTMAPCWREVALQDGLFLHFTNKWEDAIARGNASERIEAHCQVGEVENALHFVDNPTGCPQFFNKVAGRLQQVLGISRALAQSFDTCGQNLSEKGERMKPDGEVINLSYKQSLDFIWDEALLKRAVFDGERSVIAALDTLLINTEKADEALEVIRRLKDLSCANTDAIHGNFVVKFPDILRIEKGLQKVVREKTRQHSD